MRDRSLSVAGLVVLFLLVLAAACGKNPLSRTPPPPPGPPRTTSIVLAGPSTVAPGAAAEFTLTAQREGGSVLDVTREAIWSSSALTNATVSQGLVRGLALGETNISARYAPPGQVSLNQSTQIMVIPDGTFRVIGMVTERGLGGSTVSGARVEVTSGIGAGLSTISAGGHYRLYGLVGPTRIVVTKPAYRDEVRDLNVTGHQTVGLVLAANDPLPWIAGSYTLTIAASASCGNALEESLRVRTYNAQLSQFGRDLALDLSGATFTGLGRFAGRIDPEGVTFGIFIPFGYYYSNYDPSVVEVLGENRLRFVGSVAAQLSGNRISGTLAGRIELQNANSRARIAECTAQDHQFNLQKQ